VFNIFDLTHLIEVVVKCASFALLVTTTFAALISAFTREKKDGRWQWLPTTYLVSSLLVFSSAFAIFINIDHYAVVIQRLGQFVGALDALAHLHAALFLLLAMVTSARAIFVIMEMSGGRYAGRDLVPAAIAEKPLVSGLETIFRAGIGLCLAFFAGTFLNVIRPFGGDPEGAVGRPAIFTDIARQCERYEDLTRRGGFGDWDDCVRSTLSELSENEIRELAHLLTGPLTTYLLAAYFLMVIWCILIWIGTISGVAARSELRRALLLQIGIAGFSLCSLLVMGQWVSIATYRSAPLFQTAHPDGFVGGLLSGLSVLGICLVLQAFALLSMRIGSDFITIANLYRRFRTSHKSGVDKSA
jgi:hypothetical protein